ncbi:hypothetical protein CDO46_20545 [Pigmentiphaga sp. NML030171]|nr:hypothetical protein CDO46_20545 [Pigmentiphaga sp. NML030171]
MPRRTSCAASANAPTSASMRSGTRWRAASASISLRMPARDTPVRISGRPRNWRTGISLRASSGSPARPTRHRRSSNRGSTASMCAGGGAGVAPLSSAMSTALSRSMSCMAGLKACTMCGCASGKRCLIAIVSAAPITVT